MAVGLKARNLYQHITGELPGKIEQQEPLSPNYTGKHPKLITYTVFAYPIEFEILIGNLIEEEAKKPQKKRKAKKVPKQVLQSA